MITFKQYLEETIETLHDEKPAIICDASKSGVLDTAKITKKCADKRTPSEQAALDAHRASRYKKT